MRRAVLFPTVGLSVALSVLTAHAGRFTDVPTTHLHHDAIERLADKGVVTGNPDGTFAPGKTVNRAEFLTMLYRAKGLTPTATAVCMRDVIAGSWYLPVVCDAIGRGYVGGYSDGTFRPQNPVNRVEAAKMLLTVLDFPIRDYSEEDRSAIGYPDVSLSAWYTKFLAAAFRNGILPVAGQSPDAFGPEAPLSRAEAAAYIDSALRAEPMMQSSSVASSAATEQSSSSAVTTRSQRSASSQAGPITKNVSFPFESDMLWQSTGLTIYRFPVSAPTVAKFDLLTDPDHAPKSCTLYKLGADSLPSEYYLGSVSGNRCLLRVAMTAGDYQLEVRGPSGKQYGLDATVTKGDGNDGYSEAKTLALQATRVGQLEADDQADYYKFTVVSQTSLLLELSNSAETRCSVVPGADVDLFGFSSPVCGEAFTYTAGSYTVVIDRKPSGKWIAPSYGVVLKATAK